MNQTELVLRVRSMTRDFSNSIFREQDIIDYLNDGKDRFVQVMPQLKDVDFLSVVPSEYHTLLVLYSTARCFSQDSNEYKATTFMNEFEVKLEEFKGKIESGQITITNPITGLPIEADSAIDYVNLSAYWDDYDDDVDLGVEGVV